MYKRQYQIKETARPRTLVTTFGEITFHRRYYRQKETGRYTYLLDEWCQLPAYSRIEASCQARMADHAKDMSCLLYTSYAVLSAHKLGMLAHWA